MAQNLEDFLKYLNMKKSITLTLIQVMKEELMKIIID